MQHMGSGSTQQTTPPQDAKPEAGHPAEVAALKAEIAHYRTALAHIGQGICLLDASHRLVFCNDRYRDLYRLTADQVSPGTSLREIVESRCIAGTSPMDTDTYLRAGVETNTDNAPKASSIDLPDGRAIRVSARPTADGGWVSTHEEVNEVEATREWAGERISLQTLIDLVPDYLWVKDTESRFRVVNRSLASDCHYMHTSDMVGVSDFQLHPPELALEFRAIEQEIMRSGEPMIDREELVKDEGGTKKWLSSTKVPLRNERNEVIGLVGVARDITARKRAVLLQEGQIRILEQIVAGAPLEDVLDQLALLVESQSNELFCSILLLDPDGQTLRRGAAPSFSEPFLGIADGIRVGPQGASSGTAVFRKETVIVGDILHDPLWDDYRHMADVHGFRSCWSAPIYSRQGAILGTVAMYSRTVREPIEAEYRLLEFATRLAEIAIERAR